MTELHETASLWQWYHRALWDIVSEGILLRRLQAQHVLAPFFVDLEQAARSVPLLADHSIFNTSRRELRFIVEASAMICWLEQKMPDAELTEKMEKCDRKLRGGLKCINDLRLDLIVPDQREQFIADVKALYKTMCKHVHLSSASVYSRAHLSDWDEDEANPERLVDFRNLVVRGFGSSAVFLLHSVDPVAAATCAQRLADHGAAFGWAGELLDLAWLSTD